MTHSLFEMAATSVMLAMLVVSMATDLRMGKIFNALTVPCALAGLALGAIAGGLTGITDHLLGAAMVLIILLFLSPFARLGGGDIKLLMAVGALQGVHFTLWALLFTGVAGGLLALVAVVRRRVLKHTTANLLSNLVLKARGISMDLATGSTLGKIQYSFAITIGVLTALALRI